MQICTFFEIVQAFDESGISMCLGRTVSKYFRCPFFGGSWLPKYQAWHISMQINFKIFEKEKFFDGNHIDHSYYDIAMNYLSPYLQAITYPL